MEQPIKERIELLLDEMNSDMTDAEFEERRAEIYELLDLL